MPRATQRATKPNLALIASPPESIPPPTPEGLDATGLQLWQQHVTMFEWDDPTALQTLLEACFAIQRAARCRRLIDEQGEVSRTKAGLKAHPLLREETAARALGCRLLARLGTDLEPIKALGRPPGASFA